MQRRLKILAVTAAFPSAREPERGLFVENLHAALDDETMFLAPRIDREDRSREVRGRAHVRRFSFRGNGQRFKERKPSPLQLASYLMSLRGEIRGALEQFEPDIVVGHWVIPTGAAVAGLVRAAGIPFVLYAHGSDIHTYGRRGLGKVAARRALKFADHTIAVSSEIETILVSELGVDARTVSRIPMGIAPVFFDRGMVDRPALFTRDPGRLELVTIGDVSEAKGMFELVEALTSLWTSNCPARLHLVGAAGENESVLRARFPASVPSDSLVVHGRAEPAAIASSLHNADLYVHASHAEGAPLSVMEALACARPVVATQVGGIPELVRDGVTGRLVPPRDAVALATAIRELHEDRETLDRMRETLGAERSPFAMAERASEFRAVLESVLSERSSGPMKTSASR
ncbi:MAG: glycosyltransferase [Planctomycetota bacterium]